MNEQQPPTEWMCAYTDDMKTVVRPKKTCTSSYYCSHANKARTEVAAQPPLSVTTTTLPIFKTATHEHKTVVGTPHDTADNKIMSTNNDNVTKQRQRSTTFIVINK
jgi:hypothetical protein